MGSAVRVRGERREEISAGVAVGCECVVQ